MKKKLKLLEYKLNVLYTYNPDLYRTKQHFALLTYIGFSVNGRARVMIYKLYIWFVCKT